jgi:hypothetical protein
MLSPRSAFLVLFDTIPSKNAWRGTQFYDEWNIDKHVYMRALIYAHTQTVIHVEIRELTRSVNSCLLEKDGDGNPEF